MRKAQAAMEFLMTYGWAILVVLAAIGALAYFGVLSPDRFLPSKCTTTPGFGCTESTATQYQVQYVLKSNIGKDLTNYYIRFQSGDLLKYNDLSPAEICGDLAADLTDDKTWLGQDANGAAAGNFEAAQFIPAGTLTWLNGDEVKLTIGAATDVLSHCEFSGKVNIDFTIFYTQSGGTLVNQAGGSMQLQVQT